MLSCLRSCSHYRRRIRYVRIMLVIIWGWTFMIQRAFLAIFRLYRVSRSLLSQVGHFSRSVPFAGDTPDRVQSPFSSIVLQFLIPKFVHWFSSVPRGGLRSYVDAILISCCISWTYYFVILRSKVPFRPLSWLSKLIC